MTLMSLNYLQQGIINLRKFDVVVVSTDHDAYDYDFIYKNANLIVDTRNAFKVKGIQNGKLFKA